jgi:hypothetical protein
MEENGFTTLPPVLPRSLLRNMKSVRTWGAYTDPGGQFHCTRTECSYFQGVILPLRGEDLQYLPGGMRTQNTKKLYSTSRLLPLGAKVTDESGRECYTIVSVMDYDPVHSLKRYIVERGEVAP